jgi:hypothetical protein
MGSSSHTSISIPARYACFHDLRAYAPVTPCSRSRGRPVSRSARRSGSGTSRMNSGKRRGSLSSLVSSGLTMTSPTPELRYQLFHRTVSALREARRYGTQEAMLLVHAFAHDPTSLANFKAFASAIGVSGAGVDVVTTPCNAHGVRLCLAWVQDEPKTV